MVVCDGKKFQRGLARSPYSLLPAFHGVGAYIDDPCENRLAYIERLPDGADLARSQRLRWRRQFGNPQQASLSPLVIQCLLQGLLQLMKYLDLRLLSLARPFHNNILGLFCFLDRGYQRAQHLAFLIRKIFLFIFIEQVQQMNMATILQV